MSRQVSAYENALDTRGKWTWDLEAVVERIRGSPNLATLTETARNLAVGQDQAYRNFKARHLPAVTFAGIFAKGQRRNDGLEAHTGLVVLGYDDVTDPETARVWAGADPHTTLAFISPSGLGVKVVAAIDPIPSDADQHRQAWAAAAAHYDPIIGTAVDGSGKDLARLTFLAHDADAIYREDALPIFWASGPTETATIDGLDATPVARVRTALAVIPPDVAYDDWRTALMALHDAEDKGQVADGLALARDWSAGGAKHVTGEVDKKWASFTPGKGVGLGSLFDLARQHGYQPPGAPSPPAVSRNGHGPAPETQRDLFQALVLDRLDANGLATALDTMGIALRKNVRASRREYWYPGAESWEPENDDDIMELKDTIETTFRVRAGEEGIKAANFSVANLYVRLAALANKNKVDPFLEWLETLPQWDAVSLVPDWLRMMGAEPSELNIAALSGTLIGAVRRAYEPGAPHDYMPIFVGPQRSGKSLSVKYLLPPEHQRTWFTDCAAFRQTIKESVETITGVVIAEFSELTGIRQADLDAVKSFLSRCEDRVRTAYARNATDNPRRTVFIGTSNAKASGILPNDRTGNRRFVVIETRSTPARVTKWMNTHWDQLWAEALDRYFHHEPNWLPEELNIAQAEQNLEHTATNDGMGAVADDLTEKAESFPQEYAGGRSIADLLVNGGVAQSIGEAARDQYNQDGKELAEELRARGWRYARKRYNGRQGRYWFPPDGLVPS